MSLLRCCLLSTPRAEDKQLSQLISIVRVSLLYARLLAFLSLVNFSFQKNAHLTIS